MATTRQQATPDTTNPVEETTTEAPAIVSVPSAATTVPQPARVPVKYIGRHQSTKDAIYNTGTWENGQVKLVEYTVAQRMFKHLDAYTPVSIEDAKDAITEQVHGVIDDDARRVDEKAMEEARESLRPMTKEALIEYAAVHYGQRVDARKSKDAVFADVVSLIDRFGAV